MALAANREVDRYVDQDVRSFPVAASAHVFKGSFVELNDTGYAQPLTGSGRVAGLAYEEVDNSSGADGAVEVRVFTQGDFSLPLVGASAASIGLAVYASDDETLTLSADGAAFIGYVAGVPGAGQIVLRLTPFCPVGASQTEAHATSFSVTVGQSGKTFTNLGASGVVTASLPATPPEGVNYRFVCVADQELRIDPGASSGIYIKGGKQGDGKYVSITDIGDFIHLAADATGDWVAVASIGGADADISVEA